MLSAMTGSDQATELFNQEYESLLSEVGALRGPERYDFALRLRRLVDHQLAHLMNGWLRESRRGRCGLGI